MDKPQPEHIMVAGIDVGTFEEERPLPVLERIDLETKEVGSYEVPITDRVRRALAIGLVIVLTSTILGPFGLLVYIARGLEPAMRWTAEKEWLTVIFGPLVTLVATVLGYYFGSKSNGGG